MKITCLLLATVGTVATLATGHGEVLGTFAILAAAVALYVRSRVSE